MNYNLHIKPEEVVTKEELIMIMMSKIYDNTESEEDIADLFYIKELLDYDNRLYELKYWIDLALDEEYYEFLIKLQSYKLIK